MSLHTGKCVKLNAPENLNTMICHQDTKMCRKFCQTYYSTAQNELFGNFTTFQSICTVAIVESENYVWILFSKVVFWHNGQMHSKKTYQFASIRLNLEQSNMDFRFCWNSYQSSSVTLFSVLLQCSKIDRHSITQKAIIVMITNETLIHEIYEIRWCCIVHPNTKTRKSIFIA